MSIYSTIVPIAHCRRRSNCPVTSANQSREAQVLNMKELTWHEKIDKYQIQYMWHMGKKIKIKTGTDLQCQLRLRVTTHRVMLQNPKRNQLSQKMATRSHTLGDLA